MWLAIGSLVLGIALAWLIGRAISKPVVGLCAGMRELAEGNFQVVLPGLGRGDEVGDMAQAVETFKVKAKRRPARKRKPRSSRIRSPRKQRKADMIRLADTFEIRRRRNYRNRLLGFDRVGSFRQYADLDRERAQELTTMVAAASEEASTNVQSVASATEEMSSSVNEISRQVQDFGTHGQ